MLRMLRRSWRLVWRNRRTRAVLLVYAALNLLDLLTTYDGLRLGGVEANPLYAPLFAHHLFAVGALLKLVTAAVAMLAATSLYTLSRRCSLALMALCTIVLAAVVLANALHLF